MFSIQELGINIDQEDTEPGLAALALLCSLQSCCWQEGSGSPGSPTIDFSEPLEGLGGVDSVSE